MPRVRSHVASHKRRKKILKAAKGYWGARHRLLKTAKEAVMHARQYAYRDRRVRKREMRTLWIARINAGARSHGLRYGQFMEGLRKSGIVLDRRMLAEMAVRDDASFVQLVHQAAEALSTPPA